MRRAALTIALLAVLAPPLVGQGWIDGPPEQPVTVAKVRTAVRVEITGRLARVTVEEWFKNDGARLAEGVYHYPFARDAVFHDFSLWQGERELKGETLDAEQARAIYEAIVRKKRDPALIELAGHGLVRARVFPFQAGETRRVALRYTQHLTREGDALRLRWLAGTGGGRAPVSFTLTADSAARFGDAYSATHAIDVERRDGTLTVSLRDTEVTGVVDLVLPLARPVTGMTLLTHTDPGEDGYFLLLLAPGRDESARLPRDVTAVVDVSGSMSGEKLEQAKRAMLQLLGTLGRGDRFRLVAFSGGVRRFREGWSAATSATRREAGDWIRALETGGGTNIDAALATAFEARPGEGRLPVVVFLTDGRPTGGETDPERLGAQAGARRGQARVFALGVGDDVNTYVLERLVEGGRGSAAFLPPGADIEAEVASLAARISAPVLADLSVIGRDVDLFHAAPAPLPDLFAGEELVVVGRFRNPRPDWNIELRGTQGRRERRFHAAPAASGDGGRNAFIPRLWAARRVAALTRTIRLEGADPALVEEVRQLGLRFGILTEYTAYLVQEPEVLADDRRPMRMPAAQAPSEQEGRVARERAALTMAYGAARGEAALDAANKAVMSAAPAAAATRTAAGRIFVRRDGGWHDVGIRSDARQVRISAFSDAYFALVRALPELAPWLSLGNQVRVAGRAVTLEFGSDGADRLTEAAVRRIVADFRGP